MYIIIIIIIINLTIYYLQIIDFLIALYVIYIKLSKIE